VHHIEFRKIVRDAEIAYAISPVVRRHRLSAEEIEKFLLELSIPRAAKIAGITHRLVVNCSQNASSGLAGPKITPSPIAHPITFREPEPARSG